MVSNINIIICLPMKHCPSFFEWILSILIMLLLTQLSDERKLRTTFCKSEMLGPVVSEMLPISDCDFTHSVHQPHFLFQNQGFHLLSKRIFKHHCWSWLLQWLSGKESTCIAGAARHTGSVPGFGRPPEGENNQFRYTCLENPMDTVASGLQSQGCKELDITEVTQQKHAHCWS